MALGRVPCISHASGGSRSIQTCSSIFQVLEKVFLTRKIIFQPWKTFPQTKEIIPVTWENIFLVKEMILVIPKTLRQGWGNISQPRKMPVQCQKGASLTRKMIFLTRKTIFQTTSNASQGGNAVRQTRLSIFQPEHGRILDSQKRGTTSISNMDHRKMREPEGLMAWESRIRPRILMSRLFGIGNQMHLGRDAGQVHAV